ncbi:MAG: enolase C-terminal domain-like protein [Caldilineaceae bacterium]
MPEEQAYIVKTQLAPLLIGHDPLAIERLWDRMYRFQVHGRKGTPMMAQSVVDCAVGSQRASGTTPVYQLLGGPARTEIPAYASAGLLAGPGTGAERGRWMVAQGYRRKWSSATAPRTAWPASTANMRLVRTLRETVGPDVDIMLGAWMSRTCPTPCRWRRAWKSTRRAGWKNRCCPTRSSSTRRSGATCASPSPAASMSTRWGLKQLMDAGACDVLQPDIYWAGGISENDEDPAGLGLRPARHPPGHSTPASPTSSRRGPDPPARSWNT